MAEIDDYLAFAHDVLTDAGAIAARLFRQPMRAGNKRGEGGEGGEGGERGFDPVTEADRGVEARIRERIAERFPDHGVVGEEYGVTTGGSAWSWIVDPIDGTRAFVMGLPVWGCLLGLLRDGEPVGGLMHQPVLNETFSGNFSDNGGDAWIVRNGTRRRLRVRGDAALDDAVLVATHPELFDAAHLARYEALAARVRLMRYGGDCYNYALLAHGFVDIVVEDRLKAYDIQPLVPIVRGAGGVVTDREGRTPRGGSLVVAAANAELHRLALAAMEG